MDLEGIRLNEISQTGKGKYHTMSHICGILKQHSQPEFIDTENRLVARGRGDGVCEMGRWGVKRYKPPVTK